MAVEMQRNTPEPWVSHGTQALEMPLSDVKRLSQVIIRRHTERKVRKPTDEDTVLTSVWCGAADIQNPHAFP